MLTWNPARRGLLALLFFALTASLLAPPIPAHAAALRSVVTAIDATVDKDRAVRVTIACRGSKTCKGSVALSGGVSTGKRNFSIKAKKTKTVTLTLSAAAYRALTKPKSATLVVKQTKPGKKTWKKKLTVQAEATPTTPAPSPATPTETATANPAPTATSTPSATPTTTAPSYSVAYSERNWKPTEYDTCSAELHASYQVTGPDGKIYPTWHPAQVTDPATGKTCTFGHEHGADPKTSDIYAWVASHYAHNGDTAHAGLPFGYASEALDDYAHHHEGMAMRHEDNSGHKVFVANNVKLLNSDREWVRDSAGTIVTCDYLIKQHQGSWSADATANNAHELFYAMRCTDGTEVISTLLTKFGNSNEFHRSCAPAQTVTTVGSVLPAGYGGKRIIPDAGCVNSYARGASASLWGIYELWESDTRITDGAGTVLAAFDPWFGVRNPSRYYDPSASTATTNGIGRTVDLAWGDNRATGYPWSTINDLAKFDYRDPRSPFDGAQRDFYVNQTQVSASAGSTVYTDPYGGNAASTEFHGSLRQHLVAGAATGGVTLATQKFDTSADFGLNNGVHAPN